MIKWPVCKTHFIRIEIGTMSQDCKKKQEFGSILLLDATDNLWIELIKRLHFISLTSLFPQQGSSAAAPEAPKSTLNHAANDAQQRRRVADRFTMQLL